jgi:hypothetical protein
MTDPTIRTIASHVTQLASHAQYVEKDLFSLTQEAGFALALVGHIEDNPLRARVQAFAQRVQSIDPVILAEEARSIVEALERYTPPSTTPQTTGIAAHDARLVGEPRDEREVAAERGFSQPGGGAVVPDDWTVPTLPPDGTEVPVLPADDLDQGDLVKALRGDDA